MSPFEQYLTQFLVEMGPAARKYKRIYNQGLNPMSDDERADWKNSLEKARDAIPKKPQRVINRANHAEKKQEAADANIHRITQHIKRRILPTVRVYNKNAIGAPTNINIKKARKNYVKASKKRLRAAKQGVNSDGYLFDIDKLQKHG